MYLLKFVSQSSFWFDHLTHGKPAPYGHYGVYRQTSPGGVRLSRAAILQKGIEYIAYLNEQSAKQLDQLESLKKEVTAMRIMKENYEMITRAHQSSAGQGNSSTKELQVPEELKFSVVGSNVSYSSVCVSYVYCSYIDSVYLLCGFSVCCLYVCVRACSNISISYIVWIFSFEQFGKYENE